MLLPAHRPAATVAPSRARIARARVQARAGVRGLTAAPASDGVAIFEALEGRTLFSVFTVTNTLNAGAGSLRQAITDANAHPNVLDRADVVAFNIPGTGVKTISPTSPLPSITDPVTIDGYTQPGAGVNTRAVGTNGTLMIELSGANAPFPSSGLTVAAASTRIRGLVINRFNTGINLSVGAVGGVVEGNYIGTNAAGTAGTPSGHGVFIDDGARDNLIGGLSPGARNVISGNTGSGVVVGGEESTGNTVAGNYIGISANGTARVGNEQGGVLIASAPNTTIGGTTAAARNVISGNAEAGVIIQGATATGVRVQGNFIGLAAGGAAVIGNSGIGVEVSVGAHGNTIGGVEPGAANVISGNSGAGLAIFGPAVETTDNRVQGNLIGTDPAGALDFGNGGDGVVLEARNNSVGGTTPAARNVISGNGGAGVRIGIDSTGNAVQGNFIGTDAAGSVAIGNTLAGLVCSGDDNTIGGAAPGAGNVISGNGQDGVAFERDAAANHVQGNRIGTDAAGAADLGNKGHGVVVLNSVGNLIGGTAPGAGNLLSGNGGSGVQIAGALASDNRVEGNRIGTDAAGAARLPNTQNGVTLQNAPNNVIGGEAPGARNLISGNDGHGVSIRDARASSNVVAGNFIGTDAAGATALKNEGSGVFIEGAGDNLIGGTTPAARNVISGNDDDGVTMVGLAFVQGAINNRVQGNYIGTNAAGTGPLGNERHGVFVNQQSSANLIGGTTPGAGNVISGNFFDGVVLFGAAQPGSACVNNTVQGNLIGTDASGVVALGNGRNGASLFDNANDNVIGGTTPAARNVISGSAFDGVAISENHGNVIQGNFIGTDVTGTAPMPNRQGIILLRSSNTLIGGLTPEAGNLIAFGNDPGTVNTGHGVGIYTGGAGAAKNNAVRMNSIFANGGLGIDLADDRLTPNDPNDADAGENNLQNFPILTTAATSATGTAVTGVLNSTPNTTFFIDFYANTAADSAPGAAVQGRTYIGTVTVTTDAGGNASFSPTFGAVLTNGSSVTATATTINESPFGNTSEFSQPVRVSGGAAGVAGRGAFYNHSSFDGNDAGATAADDAALAPDKSALLPGGTATFANVTGYTRGINGLFVDLAGRAAGAAAPSAADLEFRVGNDNNPAAWPLAAAAATVSVRPGAGAGGSDRLTVTFPDGAIKNTWLQVTVKANARTGLAKADVFYFGNLAGETGDNATQFRINALDLGALKKALNLGSPITGRFDPNRDGRVNALDLGAVKQGLNRSLVTLAAPLGAGTSAAPGAARFSEIPVAPPAASGQLARRVWDESRAGALV